MKKLFSLFITFFKIGLFTFGGGYAMISLIQSETVSKKGWLSEDELLNIVAIAESTPGPIAINSATYIGYKQGGVLGSAFATLGVVLPSFLIIFAISFFIEDFLKIEIVNNAFKGIQAAVGVLIIRTGIKMLKNIKKNVISFVILAVTFVITVTFDIVSLQFSSIYLIIIGGIVGYIYYGVIKKERSDKASLNLATNGASDLNNDAVVSANVQSSEDRLNGKADDDVAKSSESYCDKEDDE